MLQELYCALVIFLLLINFCSGFRSLSQNGIQPYATSKTSKYWKKYGRQRIVAVNYEMKL